MNVQKKGKTAWYLRGNMGKNISVRTNIEEVVVVASREINRVLDDLQVVAGHETRAAARIGDFGFPPSIILQTKDRKHIALAKSKLLGDCGIVSVHSTSCEVDHKLVYDKCIITRNDRYLPKCKIGRPSRLNLRPGSATARVRLLDLPMGGPSP